MESVYIIEYLLNLKKQVNELEIMLTLINSKLDLIEKKGGLNCVK